MVVIHFHPITSSDDNKGFVDYTFKYKFKIIFRVYFCEHFNNIIDIQRENSSHF